MAEATPQTMAESAENQAVETPHWADIDPDDYADLSEQFAKKELYLQRRGILYPPRVDPKNPNPIPDAHFEFLQKALATDMRPFTPWLMQITHNFPEHPEHNIVSDAIYFVGGEAERTGDHEVIKAVARKINANLSALGVSQDKLIPLD